MSLFTIIGIIVHHYYGGNWLFLFNPVGIKILDAIFGYNNILYLLIVYIGESVVFFFGCYLLYNLIKKFIDMKKETTENQVVDEKEGFVEGEGYPNCEGEPCANMAEEQEQATDTVAEEQPAEPKAEQPQQPIKKTLPLEIGAKVRLMGQNGVGIIKEIRGKRAQVAFGAILTTVETARLEVISSAEFKRMTRPETPRTVISADISQRRLNFRSSIDIRGERVMEALEQVQSLVDDALMVGVSSVTILHGKGTGALKEEVRRYLRSLPQVASATDDHPDRGGSGITIVTFRD